MSRHANAHPLVNAGFSFSIGSSSTGSSTIAGCRIVVGGITRGPFTCPKTTAALVGKPLEMATLTAVLPTLQTELLPPPPTVADPNFVIPDPAYRQSVGTSLFYKFFLKALVQTYGEGSLDPKLLSATSHYSRAISKGTEVYVN